MEAIRVDIISCGRFQLLTLVVVSSYLLIMVDAIAIVHGTVLCCLSLFTYLVAACCLLFRSIPRQQVAKQSDSMLRVIYVAKIE